MDGVEEKRGGWVVWGGMDVVSDVVYSWITNLLYLTFLWQTCSHGTACNFIHCFRNPGGDYEWADWDNPPPKYWVKKMAVLFGPSDELANNDMELENWETKNSSRKRRADGSRYSLSYLMVTVGLNTTCKTLWFYATETTSKYRNRNSSNYCFCTKYQITSNLKSCNCLQIM